MAAALLRDDYSKGSVIVGDQQALDGLAGSVVVPDGCGQGQDAGDVIMLPGAGDELLVKAVCLGQGGFISPCGRQMTTRPRQNDLSP